MKKIYIGLGMLLWVLLLVWWMWPTGTVVVKASEFGAMALSPDGRTVAIAQKDGLLLVDTASGNSRPAASGESVDIYDSRLAWDLSGQYLLWEAKSAPPFQMTILRLADGQVSHLAGFPAGWWSPSPGAVPAMVVGPDSVHRIDLQTRTPGQLLAPCLCHVEYASEDGDRVLYSQVLGEIVVGEAGSGRVLRKIQAGMHHPISPSGRWLLTGASGKQTVLVDTETGTQNLFLSEGSLVAGAWTGEHSVAVATVGHDSEYQIGIATVPSGTHQLWPVTGSVDPEVNPLYLSRDGQTVWVITRDTTVTSWYTHSKYALYRLDVRTGKMTRKSLPAVVKQAVWAEQAGKVFVALEDGTVRSLGL